MTPRHIAVSSFDGVVMEIGAIGNKAGDAEVFMVRCREAGSPSRLFDEGQYTGFGYKDGHWSFVMQKPSRKAD